MAAVAGTFWKHMNMWIFSFHICAEVKHAGDGLQVTQVTPKVQNKHNWCNSAEPNSELRHGRGAPDTGKGGDDSLDASRLLGLRRSDTSDRKYKGLQLPCKEETIETNSLCEQRRF